MSRWKIAVVALVAVLAIIVVVQNTQAVETKLLFVTVTMPRARPVVRHAAGGIRDRRGGC